MKFSLAGKTVLVTGASSGIGRACAVCAAGLGARLVLTGRNRAAMDETLALCAGRGHASVCGDIASPEFVQSLPDVSGPLDGLVHSAGVSRICPAGMNLASEAEAMARVNWLAFLELAKTYSKAKNRKPGLSMVAVSSVAAAAGSPGLSAYAGTKGALSASVRALAAELAGKGIRVNAVCPAGIKTPLFDATVGAVRPSGAGRTLLPPGVGVPEQVAWPVCFLLGDAADFITGVNLPVDGGFLAG